METQKLHQPIHDVTIEAIRGVKTLNEITQEFGVHPTQVGE